MAKIAVTKPQTDSPKHEVSAFSSAFQKAAGSDITKITEATKQLPTVVAKGVQRDELRAKEAAKITWRPNPTRKVTLSHAIELADSIVAVGLIEPIAVDRNWQLLAGGHRLMAIYLLGMPAATRAAALAGELAAQLTGEEKKESLVAEISPQVPELKHSLLAAVMALPYVPELKFPVHRMEEVDASKNSKLALDIEVTENEKRRDYRPDEIVELSHQLQKAGYSFSKGRKKDGAKSGQQAIQLIIGKSSRTVHRILNPEVKAVSTGSRVRNFRPETVIEWIEAHTMIDIVRSIQAAAEKRVKQLSQG